MRGVLFSSQLFVSNIWKWFFLWGLGWHRGALELLLDWAKSWYFLFQRRTQLVWRRLGKSWGVVIEHKNFSSWRLDIFKLDLSVLEWVKLESLGDRTFFINEDANCISCCSTKSGTLGNSIYFMRHNDESMYVFDVEEKCIYTTIPVPILVVMLHKNSGLCPQGHSRIFSRAYSELVIAMLSKIDVGSYMLIMIGQNLVNYSW